MGIKKKEEAKRNVQLRQQEKQSELERSFTYQPKINEMSRYLADRRSTIGPKLDLPREEWLFN